MGGGTKKEKPKKRHPNERMSLLRSYWNDQ
jgi:hypothetical protein